MAESREEILANFQNITAIDDVAEAIMHLEETNWDLLAAVYRVLPQEETGIGGGGVGSAFGSGVGSGGVGGGSAMMSTDDVGSRNHRPPRNVSESYSISSSDDNFNNLDLGSSGNNTNNNIDVEESMTAPSSPVRMNIPASASAGRPSSSRRSSSSSSNNNNNKSKRNNNNNNGDNIMYFEDDDDDDDDEDYDENVPIGVARHRSTNTTSTTSKEFYFNINLSTRSYRIVLSSQSTIGDLKEKIADICGVPVCRQAIRGWVPHVRQRDVHNPLTVLRSLNLARETDLELTDLTDEGAMGASSGTSSPTTPALDVVSRLNETFTLNITLEPEGKLLSLNFPGVRTYGDIKNDVFTVTNIADRHQVWTGWPGKMTNMMTLAQSGAALQQSLTLKSSFIQPALSSAAAATTSSSSGSGTIDMPYRRARNIFAPSSNSSSSSNNNNKNHNYNDNISNDNQNNNVIEIDSESSVDEFEDAFNGDDELFAEISHLHKQSSLRHLMPDNVSDEVIGSIQFEQNYTQRYGEPHPEFYKGTLSDALAEACHKPAKDRKLLAIYLHHDGSVLTNVFCGQLLSCDSIIQSLSENFVLYGWDLTYESNKNMMLSSITSSIGTQASITVRNIPTDRLPAFLIISKSRSNCEVLTIIYGNVSVDDLLSQMMEAIDMYSEQQRIEIREESDRAAREQVLMEQDIAYKASLEADRAKEEAKKRKEELAANEKHRLESEKAELDAKREAVRTAAEGTLPAEPDSGYAGPVIKIRVRKPGAGAFIERKFTVDTKLKILLNYVTSIGFPVDEYKMFAGWPRKDLTTMNLEDNLQDLKLCAQETIILEER